jgi:hypothetical protein
VIEDEEEKYTDKTTRRVIRRLWGGKGTTAGVT